MVTAYSLVVINIVSIFICYDIAKPWRQCPLLGLDGGCSLGHWQSLLHFFATKKTGIKIDLVKLT